MILGIDMKFQVVLKIVQSMKCLVKMELFGPDGDDDGYSDYFLIGKGYMKEGDVDKGETICQGC